MAALVAREDSGEIPLVHRKKPETTIEEIDATWPV
jgi:hypothetical protein